MARDIDRTISHVLYCNYSDLLLPQKKETHYFLSNFCVNKKYCYFIIYNKIRQIKY